MNGKGKISRTCIDTHAKHERPAQEKQSHNPRKGSHKLLNSSIFPFHPSPRVQAREIRKVFQRYHLRAGKQKKR